MELYFRIGSTNLVLEYLRNGVYQNKIRVICQEIMTNARDANIENNLSDTPIVVCLPTKNHLVWECKDIGLGMSPTRLSDVFSVFANSTKRDDINQTGGLGLGGKTPWAYTKEFFIKTASIEEDGIRRYREYKAVVDDENECKLIENEDLCRILEEDELTGTTICVPIKHEHIYDFSDETFDVCQYWTIYPKILNSEKGISNKKPDIIYENDDFFLRKDSGQNETIVLDDIPYVIDKTFFDIPNSIKYSLNRVVLKFRKTEVTPTISRESLQYTDKTISSFNKKILKVVNDLKKYVENEIKDSIDVIDAYKQYIKFNNIISGISILYKNIDLKSLNISLYDSKLSDFNCSLYSYVENKKHVSNQYVMINPTIPIIIKNAKNCINLRLKEACKQLEVSRLIYIVPEETPESNKTYNHIANIKNDNTLKHFCIRDLTEFNPPKTVKVRSITKREKRIFQYFSYQTNSTRYLPDECYYRSKNIILPDQMYIECNDKYTFRSFIRNHFRGSNIDIKKIWGVPLKYIWVAKKYGLKNYDDHVENLKKQTPRQFYNIKYLYEQTKDYRNLSNIEPFAIIKLIDKKYIAMCDKKYIDYMELPDDKVKIIYDKYTHFLKNNFVLSINFTKNYNYNYMQSKERTRAEKESNLLIEYIMKDEKLIKEYSEIDKELRELLL